MSSKFLKYIKISVMLAIIFAFAWFLLVYPTYKFKKYEGQLKEAAERYYELNPTQLPTGERVATVTLQTLFSKSYMKEDIYIPYTKKPCSITNSWVKVTKKDNDYNYIVYLECGAIKSTVDHKGPQITLKGKMEETIEVNEDYKDPGVAKVYDKSDGNLDVENVKIDNRVKTKEPGEYEIKYSAVDKLGNKTVVVRKVKVINTLNNYVKNLLKGEKRFKGNPDNNYIRLSNMEFRIVGLTDEKNVIVIAEKPISLINYNMIDEWLNNYYYNHLSDTTKKMIVKNKFCKSVGQLTDNKCKSYTEERNIYYPSIADVNLSSDGTESFVDNEEANWIVFNKPTSVSLLNEWLSGEKYKTMKKTDISAIRPMFVVNGKEKILSGDGSSAKQLILKDNVKANGNTSSTELKTGDYLKIKGIVFKIIESNENGLTKVVSDGIIDNYEGNAQVRNLQATKIEYNPKDKKSVAYQINNKLSKYIDKSMFEAHEIEVPIYKDIIYKKEIKTKKYKVLYSAPNAFEMFSAQPVEFEDSISGSYWFINTSTNNNTALSIDVYGNVSDETYYNEYSSAKVVAYLKKDTYVSGGDGTRYNPYIIK